MRLLMIGNARLIRFEFGSGQLSRSLGWGGCSLTNVVLQRIGYTP